MQERATKNTQEEDIDTGGPNTINWTRHPRQPGGAAWDALKNSIVSGHYNSCRKISRPLQLSLAWHR